MAKVPFADDVGGVAGRGEYFCDRLFGKVEAPRNLLRGVRGDRVRVRRGV